MIIEIVAAVVLVLVVFVLVGVGVLELTRWSPP